MLILSLSAIHIYWIVLMLNGGGSPLKMQGWSLIKALSIGREAGSCHVASSSNTLGH